jgi:hypothetical protein
VFPDDCKNIECSFSIKTQPWPLPRTSWSWTVLLPIDTHTKPITSVTAVLLPFVTYLLTLSSTMKSNPSYDTAQVNIQHCSPPFILPPSSSAYFLPVFRCMSITRTVLRVTRVSVFAHNLKRHPPCCVFIILPKDKIGNITFNGLSRIWRLWTS